jgi:hypothetical protein
VIVGAKVEEDRLKTQSLKLAMFAVVYILHSAALALGADYKQELLFVLNGMKKERSALKNGICRMTGNTVFKSLSSGQEDMEGELSIYSAFDNYGQIRFDRTQPGWVIDLATIKDDPERPGMALSSMKKGIVNEKYYKNWTFAKLREAVDIRWNFRTTACVGGSLQRCPSRQPETRVFDDSLAVG